MNNTEAKQKSTFRPRRPHKKSRNGCLRCKKEKRKCDELQPRCSRCEKRNVTCVKPEGKEKHVKECEKRYATLSHLIQQCNNNNNNNSSSSHDDIDTQSEPRKDLLLLDPVESELFNHYLEHTARSVAADSADLYALTTGIKRLVSDSKIIMHSVLALAAIHKCSTMLSDPVQKQLAASGRGRRDKHAGVTHLLHAAEQYHRQVLHQARGDVKHMRRYDHVMVNAALMVLYSCANHSVRISLMTETAGGADDACSMPGSFRPGDLQWMSMIRAIQSAYSGLSNSRAACLDENNFHSPSDEQPYYCMDMPRSLFDELDLCGVSGPIMRTRRLFLPIVAATWNGALDRLDAAVERSRISELRETASVSEYQMCTSAMRLLRDIFLEVFTAKPSSQASSPDSSSSEGASSSSEGPSKADEIAKLEPWLRDYLARVTSKAPRQPLRRAIMAFVHRLPSGYTELVQNAIDVTSRSPDGQDDATDDDQCSIERLSLQRLAVDIFAHWLVLVMLLDGIWWIGEIGTWELKQAISAMAILNRLDGSQYLCGWWPSSMYNTKLEIDQHEVRDLD
ncbi:hypothetical protein PFICI_04427 [Pestalotiopsis fici W106-1]|uniref:Zn(2)-C6 fungal-type domain-containing protein n=1 Tax=Pestalotiopsis fici (strain W106-1 / CGMCC3.15140) TaxID=1229662 RepID=W3XBI4_PESFW|nr:uncharacterized protein PFICI_04427 [Pestalotiopsis fici W106-1]ETS82551.1 hypothetical protein PFICI_04427 [Pestalotiopsis fici W106-1]